MAVERRQWLTDRRKRLGLSQEALARQMMVDQTTVGRWERGEQELRDSNVVLLAEALDFEVDTIWSLLGRRGEAAGSPDAERQPGRDLRTVDFVGWLADHSSTDFAEIYRDVVVAAERMESESVVDRRAREHAVAGVTRADLADAISTYYEPTADLGLYRANVGGAGIDLSILTRPAWLDVAVQLGTDQEQLTYQPPDLGGGTQIDSIGWHAAVKRLASVEEAGTVMVNNPLYRLLAVDVGPQLLQASVTLSDFASYALTSDLLEQELVDLIASGGARAAAPGRAPLRDLYLPSIGAAMDLESRHCAGGVVALWAIARAAQGDRPADYALLVQQRSGRVLNAAEKLAVIPKAFHQPIAEPAEEASLITTLLREVEEELLGRTDLEQLSEDSWRQADVLHDGHRSAPMQRLVDQHGSTFLTECIGLGFNLITGTYEFPCLIVVDDETWWEECGHLVEANWEAMRLLRYSTRDTEGLTALVHDPRWSNEGLFALLQGLRRLSDHDNGTGRVAAPSIELEVR